MVQLEGFAQIRLRIMQVLFVSVCVLQTRCTYIFEDV